MTTISSTLLAGQLVRPQLGKETAWGSQATATALWMSGTADGAKITPLAKETIFPHQLGSLAPGFLHAKLQSGGNFVLPGTLLYEEAMIAFGWALGTVSPSGGGPYVWANAASLTSVPAVQPYTIELGNVGDSGNSDSMVLTGCLPQSLKVSGEIGKEMTFEVSGFGQQFLSGKELTGALTQRTGMEPVLFLGSSFYLDPFGTAPGTTPFTNTLSKFDLTIDTGIVPVFAAGQTYPINWTHKIINYKLSMSFLMTTTLRTFLTTNLLRDSSSGNQVGATVRIKGASGTKIVQMDMAGMMDADPSLFDRDQDVQAISVSMSGLYEPTSMANYLKTSVTNSISALP